MSKYFYVIIGVFFLILSCDNKDNPVIPPKEGDAQRTVLAYLIGDNSGYELSGHLINDFQEMCQGMANVDDSKNNLLVYSETSNDLPHLIHVKKVKGKVVADTIKTYTEQNALDKAVMTGILQEVIQDFPAESYGLILASHGEGWLQGTTQGANPRWFGDYRGFHMNIADIEDVLINFPTFDFILFDACYMQAVEVAYELKDCTKYLISSPSEIPGPGAPYQIVIPKMFADKQDVAIDIASGYYDYYEGIYNKSGEWKYGVTISAVKTSELTELASATRDILPQYIANGEDIDRTTLFYYDGHTKRCYYDFSQLMRYLTNEDENFDTWYAAFTKCCTYFKTTPTNAVNQKNYDDKADMTGSEGLGIYIPRRNSPYNTFYRTLKWYNEGGWKETGW